MLFLFILLITQVIAIEISRFTLYTKADFGNLPVLLLDGDLHASNSLNTPQVFALQDDHSLWAINPYRQIVESATLRIIESTDSTNVYAFVFDVSEGYLTCRGSSRFYRGTSVHLDMDDTITTLDYSFTELCKLKVVLVDDDKGSEDSFISSWVTPGYEESTSSEDGSLLESLYSEISSETKIIPTLVETSESTCFRKQSQKVISKVILTKSKVDWNTTEMVTSKSIETTSISTKST